MWCGAVRYVRNLQFVFVREGGERRGGGMEGKRGGGKGTGKESKRLMEVAVSQHVMGL